MKDVFVTRIEEVISNEQLKELLSITEFIPSTGFNFKTGKAEPTAHRTSSTHYDTQNQFISIVKTVLQRLKDDFGHEYRLEQCEPMQLQKYEPNQFFKPHWDFFNVPGYEQTTPNDRIATAIIYLKTAEEGGTTNFPDLNLNISSNPGDVIYFTYDDDEIKVKTKHEGTPIIRGEKMIATLWIRKENYR
jgi:prolyl 4-hydroxylase